MYAQTFPVRPSVGSRSDFVSRRGPAAVHLALTGGAVASVDPRLLPLRGEVEIVVRLGDAPLAVAQGDGAKKLGGKLTKAQQRAHIAGLSQKQDDLMRTVSGMGGRELSRLNKSLNAVILKVDEAGGSQEQEARRTEPRPPILEIGLP